MNWTKLLSNKRIKKSNNTDIRNAFESDFGRIIYSPALRRMHDKTQVFPLTTNDNIHTRLTHSNEVMALGYTFGLKLSQSEIIQKKTNKTELELTRTFPILLQNICFIHDIGNTPFGHFGETIISNYFNNLNNCSFSKLDSRLKRDFLFFDGNAQGLRVLTKLQYLDNSYGLNLTYATLSSYLKYPNYKITNKEQEIKKGDDQYKIEKSKHGVFFSEEEYFKLIMKECELVNEGSYFRHPLCYLMEASDSIAYLCMDMEDGFNKGIYNIDFIHEKFKDREEDICKQICKICDDKLINNNTKIVNIRIKLISYFVELAYNNFEENLDKIETGQYNKELIEDDSNKIYEIVKKFSNEIFKSREINYLESTGYSVITGLLNFYIKFLFNEDKSYVKRAKRLISKSTIQCAVDECLVEITDTKLSDAEKHEINTSDKSKCKKLKEEYIELIEKQQTEILKFEDLNKLKEVKGEIYEIIKPDFEDLNDYYKYRVIVDFISGMTDKFAVTHFQRISGQKIN